MQFLAIKKFAELQHYKDRHPPWIRLYNRLLDDYAFLQLSEVAQRHLICLWLLASRHDNRIPFDLTYICRAIQAKSVVDIDELIGAGFVEKTEEIAQVKDNRKNGKLGNGKRLRPRAPRKRRASKPLADCKQNAVPETETEERQREKQPPASGEAVNPFAFMGRINAVHREFYGGEPPKGTATALAPLVAALGVDDLEARFRVYCQKTQAAYVSIPKFARSWKAYSPEPAAPRLIGVGGEPTPEELASIGIRLA